MSTQAPAETSVVVATPAGPAADSVAVEVVTPAPASAAGEAKVKKPRRVVDADSVAAAFDELEKFVLAEIDARRAAKNSSTAAKTGNTGIKSLRTINSRIKLLKKDAVKVMAASKKRPRRAASTKSDGGFLKAHHIIPEMAQFAECPPETMMSRVNITNVICNYIRDAKLQDPSAKKNILPDEKLRNLLQYDPSVPGNKPLTYFYLQKLIGRLQVKEVATKA